MPKNIQLTYSGINCSDMGIYYLQPCQYLRPCFDFFYP